MRATRPTAGIGYGACAYLLWGLSALYWPALRPAGTLEMISMRAIWSLLILLLLVLATGRWQRLRALARRPRQVGWLVVASLLTAANWSLFVFAVTNGHVVDASMGYFISPLFAVLLGVLALRESINRRQLVAVGFGAASVLALVLAYGRTPWIALLLAGTFALYGVIKKKLEVGALEGMTIETAVLLVPSVVYNVVIQLDGTATFGHVSAVHTLLMMGASVVMMLPMLLFSAAANRIPLSAAGMLQYIEPIVQFVIGVLVFQEKMPAARWLAFVLVWSAVAVASYDAFVRGRQEAARPRQLSSTSEH